MADHPDEKSKLPLTGLLALLVAAVSSLIIYQVPLKTSRPIDKEAEKTASVTMHRVQSRLWQDPFEAVTTHLAKETTSQHNRDLSAQDHHSFSELIQAIMAIGGHSQFTILPVFVDGNPYASGVEARLRDRYAVVSALGTAGYLPESGEYIRFFEWQRTASVTVVIPVEWFVKKSQEDPAIKQVLVLWLRDQDFGPRPLTSLGSLAAHMNAAFRDTPPAYTILGPRTSGSLAAMVSELKEPHHEKTLAKSSTSNATGADKQFAALKGSVLYSSWATAADTFLLGTSPQSRGKSVEDWFTLHGFSLVRTIGTDAMLSEQLVEDLQRREITLRTPTSTSAQCDAPHVALISEWDTLYGRALPRTFVAAAEHRAEKVSQRNHPLENHIDTSSTAPWPCWVRRYSYLAGLDGELPPKTNEKEPSVAQSKDSSPEKFLRTSQGTEETPTGRSQLDYVRRLTETLKRDAIEFKAIGVLGSDVYDKLMILQALRNDFPRAVFFTTDLDARLTHSGQGQWTRNLIVASHFGLDLHPDLQTPIPSFRDSYQTALFYSVLQAVQYLVPVEHGELRNSVTGMSYSIAGGPRLYEIGRHGAVDISVDEPRAIPSIHAPRLDLDLTTGQFRLPDSGRIGWALFLLSTVTCCALLLNSKILELFQARRHREKWVFALLIGCVLTGLLFWAMRDGAAGEPFSLTEGISVWPTTFIRLIAFVLCILFLKYAWARLRDNDRALTERFGFQFSAKRPAGSRSLLGIHSWRPSPSGDIPVANLWAEYLALGDGSSRLIRIAAQTLCYALFGWSLMQLFGLPAMPCRGTACFEINRLILTLSVIGMTILIFYVVDATRLCRRLITILTATTVHWPAKVLAEEAARHKVDASALPEWLGIELIAQRTAVISVMLYYPFVTLFLMGLARHTYFDRWDFPLSLMVIFGLNTAYALGNAVYLRRSAEVAKRAALDRLRGRAAGLPENAPRRPQLDRMADLIERNQTGAFLPFTQHPLFGAIALPTGGTGLVLFIEYVATVM
jgi:hypothetical protein